MWVTQAVQMYRNSFVFQIAHVTHFGSLLVSFFDFFYSSRRDLFNNINSVVTKVLIYLQDFFYFFFTFSLSFISLGVPRRVERSDKKNTLACWSSDSDTTSTIKKILTGQIPKHHKNDINGDQSVSHKSFEGKWVSIHLDYSCSSLRWPFVIFFSCRWICLVDIFQMI